MHHGIQIEKWIKRTQPSTPSFIFMYWKKEQGGRPNLVWAGIKVLLINSN